MREIWVKRITILTGLMVLLLSAIFAIAQNTSDTFESTVDKEQSFDPKSKILHMLDPESVAAGRKVYNQAFCSSCHIIAGKGYPRNSLDNVGNKYTAEELRNWVIGSETLRGVLPENVLRLKQEYRAMPEDDLKVLIIYLQNI